MKVFGLFVFILVNLCAFTKSQIRFSDHFANCHRSDPRFDSCLRDAINSVRPYFKTGLPQYGVRPFDPFHADEVVQTRGGPGFNYKLTLRNVTEAGWTSSQIMRFKSDFNNNFIEFSHFFPDKKLTGSFEFDAEMFGRKIRNSGNWNLVLYDYTQNMMVTRKPRMSMYGEPIFDTPCKVNVDVRSCRHMELHVSHLLGGRPLMENIADRLINAAWPPGFYLLRPLIGDLVSTAFTKIFNDNFMNFPFDELIN
ncbi:PREDICTED: uncharacterized protein LOC108563157 [Nicrophorus vespilloides]|uniref:Uncharacterized protein LOC108563157 n=1 Tax=Nicrophorus vespilloides TaxID=110193 RepID=A0ABM1MRP5_NICVS|nr:PREDICTED: uncharacterized protein LOC108563157 [Nicrophorus vespilloides]